MKLADFYAMFLRRMSEPRVFALDALRTDGWFERVGQSITSFPTLCEIIGERFFAFSLITGVRITALTVDRRVPANTLVDFVETGGEQPPKDALTQRLNLKDFRERLVSELLAPTFYGPAPERLEQTEAMQQHIGLRFLLVAPLFGFRVLQLFCSPDRSELLVSQRGAERRYPLDDFRQMVRAELCRELESVSKDAEPGVIDLSRVALAEQANQRGDQRQVVELLRGWVAPLTLFLRTTEGQTLNAETRTTICRALALLGTALCAEHEPSFGEEVLRLGIQYSQGTPPSADMYARLGSVLLQEQRSGEAIGLLRRSANLGGDPQIVWPLLSRALLDRQRYLAALAAALEGRRRGVTDPSLAAVQAQAEAALGEALTPWKELMGAGSFGLR